MKAIANVALGLVLFILVTAAVTWLWVYCHPLLACVVAVLVTWQGEKPRRYRRNRV